MKGRLLLLVIGLILLVLLLLLTPLRYMALGWFRGESFYNGWPSSYWVDALANQDPEVRHQATWALERLGPKADQTAVAALIKALEDHKSEVRWGAACALGEIGKCPQQVVPALSRTMSSDVMGDRVWATTGIGLFGPEAKAAVPTLTQALDDKSPIVRSGAAWALGRVGPDARSAVPKLLGMVGDDALAPHEPFTRTVGDMASAALWAIDPNGAKQAGVPMIAFPWDRFGQYSKY